VLCVFVWVWVVGGVGSVAEFVCSGNGKGQQILLSVGWQSRLDQKARGDIQCSVHTWQNVTSVNTAEREKLLRSLRRCLI
jgi:hypothetical protein